MKSLTPIDFGTSITIEDTPRIQIKDLLKQCRNGFKETMITSQLKTFGIEIELITTQTKFNGIRFWFKCPQCKRRAGVLYKHPISQVIGCRICLNLSYRKQRYKGMEEDKISCYKT